jgi:hypothetical protein
VWPSKLAQPGLNPTLTELDDFGLRQVNFLPGLAGIYMGFLSPFWLALFLALLGLLCGLGERFLFRRCTSARLVLLAGTVCCALEYEAGLPAMLTVLRAAVVIAAVLKAAEKGLGIPRARANTAISGASFGNREEVGQKLLPCDFRVCRYLCGYTVA